MWMCTAIGHACVGGGVGGTPHIHSRAMSSTDTMPAIRMSGGERERETLTHTEKDRENRDKKKVNLKNRKGVYCVVCMVCVGVSFHTV